MLISTALLLSPLAVSAPVSALEPAADTFALDTNALQPIVFEPMQGRANSGRGESEHMLSWKFAEVHVLQRDVDAIDDDLTGFGGRFAWQFQQGFFARGGVDVYSDDVDLKRYDVGVGQSVPLQNGVDAFASVSWVWLELDGDGGVSADENGWRAEAGVRGALDSHLESEGRLGYEDVADDGFVWGLDVRYWFVPQAAVGIGYEREVNDGTWVAGLRYSF